MTGPTRLVWALSVFVVLVGAVLWLVTGRAVFAVFIALGLLTAGGFWLTGRTAPAPRPPSVEKDTP